MCRARSPQGRRRPQRGPRPGRARRALRGRAGPWGENCRYDFVIETEDGQLLRVQCKTGRLRDGAVRFQPCSVSYHHPKNRRDGPTESARRDYRGEADLFAVDCVETRKVYLVPVDDVPTVAAALRIDPTRNGQSTGIRWAAQYELHPPE